MTSGKKAILFIFLLLPVTVTTLFGLMQRHHFGSAPVWLNLVFYASVVVFSISAAVIIMNKIVETDRSNQKLRMELLHADDEKQGTRILNDSTLNLKYDDETSMRLLIDHISDYAIFMLDINGNIASWNNGAQNIKGYHSEEIIGHPLSILYTSEDVLNGIPESNLLQTRKEGSYKTEGWRVRKDGSLFWADITFTVLKDNIGQLKGYAKVTRDESRRKQLETQLDNQKANLEKELDARTEKISRHEKRFRALIENSNDAILLLDSSFKMIYRSPSAVRVTGWSDEEDMTSKPDNFIYKDDIETVGAVVAESIKNPGKPYPVLFRCLHKKGHFVWLQGTLTNMLENEDVRALVFNAHDATQRIELEKERKETERKLIESEQLYKSLFQNMLHGYAYCKGIFDGEHMIDFTYLAVNHEYETLTGIGDVTGKNVSEVNPVLLASNPEYARLLSRVALSGKPERFEAYVERRDKWFSTSVYSPATGYFVGLLYDITDQKRAEHKNYLSNVELEKKVVLRTEELKRKNEEMEAFSYSVSHDLRAPLRGIIGFTTILEEEYSSKLDGEARRLTGIIRHNTQKMGMLIDDLLAFSKMGRQQIKKTLLDTNVMVDQIIQELENKIGQQKIEWVIQPMGSVQGDSNTIHQVWVNLLSNAIKYSGRNPLPKIEIHSFRKADQMVFEVKDNGVGFDPEYTGKLFKVFQRLHGANEFDGTGVGLAIVEKIVSRHGGKVWAESQVNKGASFFFSLPAN